MTTTPVYVASPGIGFFRNITAIGRTTTSLELSRSDIISEAGETKRGVYIESENDISVQVILREDRTTDGFLALPYTVLSNEYYVVSYTPVDHSEFVVTAPENDTVVVITFKLSLSYVYYRGRTYHSGDVLAVSIGMLDTLQFKSRGDLTGTHITSDKPISFTSGNKCAYVPHDKQACDYLIEQIPPVKAWKRMYLTTALKTRRNNRIRILSSVNGNRVHVGSQSTITLDKSSFYEHVDTNNAALNIRGDEPILVVQYAEGTMADNQTGDPSMIIVPSQLDHGSEAFFITEDGLPKHYISVTLKTEDTNGLYLDSSPIQHDDVRSVVDVDEYGITTVSIVFKR